MNFLQICQRLNNEAGEPGTGSTTFDTVVSQAGLYGLMVDWAQSAYQDIQSQHANWEFMRSSFSFSTTATQREYTPLQAGLTDLESWKKNEYGDFRMYLSSAGVNSEQYMHYIPWDDYRQMYLFGATRTSPGQPTYFSIHPNKNLDLYLVPDDIYVVSGEYYKQPETMTLDADTPNFQSQFHMAIVWRALMMYGAHYAADEKYKHGQNEYKKILRRLEFDQLPQMSFGAPLA